jgi:hypothetical protein
VYGVSSLEASVFAGQPAPVPTLAFVAVPRESDFVDTPRDIAFVLLPREPGFVAQLREVDFIETPRVTAYAVGE